MCISEDEGAEFHDGNETREIEDFGIGISPIENTGKVEEFGPLVDLRPESLLESFLRIAESSGLLDEVQVGENTNDFWEAVRLKDVEELESFLSGKSVSHGRRQIKEENVPSRTRKSHLS